MLRHCSVVLVMCVICCTPWTSALAGEPSISCDFEHGQCGWKDSGNTTLHWTRDTCSWCIFGDDYMALDMENVQVNDTGLLFSPMLHGSVNKTCRLSFTRHIKNDNRACQLAVFLVTETTWTLLWRTVKMTGKWESEKLPNLQVPCTEPSFQIAFEGKKIKSESCGGTVDVNNIVFEYSQQVISRPSPTPTTSVPTTQLSTGNTHVDTNTQPSVNITGTAPDNSQTNNPTKSAKDSDSGVSSAVIAAVVAVILAVVIIICLILIVFFLRRRAKKQENTDHWTLHLFRTQKTPSRPHRASAVFTNSQDVPYSGQGQANPESADQARIQSGGDRASVHLYSTAEDHRYSTLDYPRDEHRYSNLDGNRNSTPDDDNYITPVDDVNDGYEIPSPAHHRQTGRSNHNYYNA